MEKVKNYKVYGIELPIFVFFVAVILASVCLDVLPVEMIGAIAIMGWFVGFYPVESAVTAGLCMTNMGGAGDLAVLGAAKRMDLISYAQISSRIGGAIVLLIASVVFSII